MVDFTLIPPQERVLETAEAVKARGINVEIVNTREEALARVQALIPAGASLMTGGSQSLLEIGLEDILIAKDHPWRNLKDEILAEEDPVKQNQLRRESILADYYLGSVQAIAKTGEIVVGSGSGSQLPAYAFSSPNLIWVAGVQKITEDLNQAIQRVREYNLPYEDARFKKMGRPGASLNKLLIIEGESAYSQRNITLILVNESLGV
jgi:hypothetical protein